MKTLPFNILLTLLCLCSCSRPASPERASSDKDTLAVIMSHYNNDLYDQGHTEGCWIYAMLACIETEQQRRGDSITLSRQWLMSHALEDQLMEYREQGTDISLRGVGRDVLRLIDKHGLVPYNMEKSRINNSRVLQRKLRLLAEQKTLTTQELHDKAAEILPQFTVSRHSAVSDGGVISEPSFYYYSMHYTPRQFAESVIYYQHWDFYASDSRYQWHEPYVLPVPDNRYRHTVVNLPPSELLAIVIQSLRKGHPVYWEMSKKADTQSSDHAMAVMGLRVGKDGKPRLLCLNSYGKEWGNNGYCLVSQDYFLHHTCNVGVIR